MNICRSAACVCLAICASCVHIPNTSYRAPDRGVPAAGTGNDQSKGSVPTGVQRPVFGGSEERTIRLTCRVSDPRARVSAVIDGADTSQSYSLARPQVIEIPASQSGDGNWTVCGRPTRSITLLVEGEGRRLPKSRSISIDLPERYRPGSHEVPVEVPIVVSQFRWTGRPTSHTAVQSDPTHGRLIAGVFESTDSSSELEELSKKSFETALGVEAFKRFSPFDEAATFEVRRDVMHLIRDRGGLHTTVVDAESKAKMPDLRVQVDLVDAILETSESVARTSGSVQVGVRKSPNVVYHDLVKARVAAEGLLAGIASGKLDADAARSSNEATAALRLLAGASVGRDLGRVASASTLFGALDALLSANTERQRSGGYQELVDQARLRVADLDAAIRSMSPETSEPVYHEFRNEDKYVVKSARALAYVRITDVTTNREIVDRKIVVEVVEADAYREGDARLGRAADPLELPPDGQMRSKAREQLAEHIVRAIVDGYLGKLGLEHAERALLAEGRLDGDEFAVHAVKFLTSPAASVHAERAESILASLQDLVEQVAGEKHADLRRVFHVETQRK